MRGARLVVALLLLAPAAGLFPLGAQTATPPAYQAPTARPPASVPSPTPETEAARELFAQAVEWQLAAQQVAPPEAHQLLARAAAGYRKVLSVRPHAAAAWYNLGRALRDLGDPAAAGEAFARAADRQHSGGARRAYYLRQWADFLDETGDADRARLAREEAVLAEPRLDDVHAELQRSYLAAAATAPERLLGYLWRLVEAQQATRGADLALTALESGWRAGDKPELLAAIAASLARMNRMPREVLESTELARLRPFASDPAIGAGVDELIRLYTTPGSYAEPFRWWSRTSETWSRERGLSRADALRAAMRSVGDRYRERRESGVAVSCYRAALELSERPDPLALRRLAAVYVERDDLPALETLARTHADPAGSVFREKGRLYVEGRLDEVLDYHRALGQIYGSLAAAGKLAWGSVHEPATALFQLDRALAIAERLEDDAADGETVVTRVDPDLALLYVRGLEATGQADAARRVRVDTARRFQRAGDTATRTRILETSVVPKAPVRKPVAGPERRLERLRQRPG